MPQPPPSPSPAEPGVGPPTPGSALARGAPLLLALLTALAWGGSLVRGGFAYDDREVLFGNPVVEGELPWSAVFDRDYWHHISAAGHWRPLATLSLRVDRGFWGDDPLGYHATNLLLHMLVVALAAFVLGRLVRNRQVPLPWFGLALFAVHPLLADSVAWISGRTSMLSALGGLLGASMIVAGTGAGRRAEAGMRVRCLFGGLLGVGLALMGKEDGLAFTAVLPLIAAGGSGAVRHSALTLLGGLAAVGAWLLARKAALGVALPVAPHAPLADVALFERLSISAAAWSEGLAAALLPLIDLPPSLTVQDVEGPALWPRLALLAVLMAVALGVALSMARPGRCPPSARLLALASLVSVTAAIAPLTQLVPSGELFAPRFLYLPLLFGAPAVAALARALVPRASLRPIGATAVILGCIVLSWGASGRYADRRSFWRAHLPRHAGDARVWNALGNAAREGGDSVEARESWERAVELDPDYSRPRVNLGTLALQAGNLERGHHPAARGRSSRAQQPRRPRQPRRPLPAPRRIRLRGGRLPRRDSTCTGSRRLPSGSGARPRGRAGLATGRLASCTRGRAHGARALAAGSLVPQTRRRVDRED